MCRKRFDNILYTVGGDGENCCEPARLGVVADALGGIDKFAQAQSGRCQEAALVAIATLGRRALFLAASLRSQRQSVPLALAAGGIVAGPPSP